VQTRCLTSGLAPKTAPASRSSTKTTAATLHATIERSPDRRLTATTPSADAKAVYASSGDALADAAWF
jgi:hypothetical protein